MKRKGSIVTIIFLSICVALGCDPSETEKTTNELKDSLQIVAMIDSLLDVRIHDNKDANRSLAFRAVEKLKDSFHNRFNDYPNRWRDSVILRTREVYNQIIPNVRYAPPALKRKDGTYGPQFIQLKSNWYDTSTCRKMERFFNDSINKNILIPTVYLNSQGQLDLNVTFKKRNKIYDLEIKGNSQDYMPIQQEFSRLFHILNSASGIYWVLNTKASRQYQKQEKEFMNIALQISVDSNLKVSVQELKRDKTVIDELDERGYFQEADSVYEALKKNPAVSPYEDFYK